MEKPKRRRRSADLDQHERDDLREATDEAGRRIAARGASSMRTKIMAAIAKVKRMATGVFDADLPGIERRRRFEDLLDEAIGTLPRPVDSQAIADRTAVIIADADRETLAAGALSVTRKQALPSESVDDVKARVLVERKYSATGAIALAQGLTPTEANGDAARKKLKRSINSEEARRDQPRAVLSFSHKARLDAAMDAARPELLARRERQTREAIARSRPSAIDAAIAEAEERERLRSRKPDK